MLIDPTTPEGQAFIADFTGEPATTDVVSNFVHDECVTCMTCGSMFTSERDMDMEVRREIGEWICQPCSDNGEAEDTIDFHREFGTWRSL